MCCPFQGALKGARVDGLKWPIVKDWFAFGGPYILSRGCSGTTLAFLVRLLPGQRALPGDRKSTVFTMHLLKFGVPVIVITLLGSQ